MKRFLYFLLLSVCLTCFSTSVTYAQDVGDSNHKAFVPKIHSTVVDYVFDNSQIVIPIAHSQHLFIELNKDALHTSFAFDFTNNTYPQAKDVNWRLVCENLPLEAILNKKGIVNPQKLC